MYPAWLGTEYYNGLGSDWALAGRIYLVSSSQLGQLGLTESWASERQLVLTVSAALP